jgi:hypothetical protein
MASVAARTDEERALLDAECSFQHTFIRVLTAAGTDPEIRDNLHEIYREFGKEHMIPTLDGAIAELTHNTLASA